MNTLYCRLMENRIYDHAGDRDFPLRYRLELAFHIVFCPRCAEKTLRLESARSLMRTDFLPAPPEMAAAASRPVRRRSAPVPARERSVLENRVMESLAFESIDPAEEPAAAPDFRSWVAGGILIMLSLGTVILGLDFASMAALSGSSFLIPVGLTVGGVITVYGALFIGSHIEELSDRFGLR